MSSSCCIQAEVASCDAKIIQLEEKCVQLEVQVSLTELDVCHMHAVKTLSGLVSEACTVICIHM